MPQLTYLTKGQSKTIDLNLSEGEEFFIGRGDDADLTVIDREMSRIHAKILCVAGTFSVIDCDSSNGIIVDEVTEREVLLDDMSEFTLGNTIFTLHLVECDVSEACTIAAPVTTVQQTQESPKPATPPQSDQPKNMRLIGEGLEFNGIRLEQALNRRGITHTFRGYQTDIARTVSVKFLQTRLTSDPEYPHYFERIMKHVTDINAHPSMAKVFEYGNHDGFFYIVGEWVDGNSAERVMNKSGVINVKQGVEIALAAAEMIDFLKQNNTVNGQIKPANIVINHGHPPRFLCAGLMNLVKSELTNKVKEQLEFPYFSSPEQVDPKRGQVTPASDVYSLGATLYYLLSGEPVFDGDKATDIELQHLSAAPRPLEEIDFEIPEKLNTLIMSMLEKEPAQRIDIETIIARLTELSEELGEKAKVESQRAITAEIPHSKHRNVRARRTVAAKEKSRPNAKMAEVRQRKKKEKEKQSQALAYVFLALVMISSIFIGIYLFTNDPAEQARQKSEALNKQNYEKSKAKTTVISQDKLKKLLKETN